LRASRVLAAADVLVAPSDADRDVLGLARRDAERLSLDEATPERLIALVGEGLKVACLITAPPDPAALRTYAEAGLEIEVLLAAPEA
ncbi:MAG: siroheme synthase, partial [Phenylobacterium sp.]